MPGANAASGAPTGSGCTFVPRGTSRDGKIESQCAKPISRSVWFQVFVGRRSDAYGDAGACGGGVVCAPARDAARPARKSSAITPRRSDVVMRRAIMRGRIAEATA